MSRAIPGAAVVLIAASLSSGAFAADGAALFAKECASCHGATGLADTPVGKAMKTPPLVGETPSAEQLAAVVNENAKHKKLAGKLDDAQLAAISEFMKTLGAP